MYKLGPTTELLKKKAGLDEQEEVLREAAGDALDMFSIEVRGDEDKDGMGGWVGVVGKACGWSGSWVGLV